MLGVILAGKWLWVAAAVSLIPGAGHVRARWFSFPKNAQEQRTGENGIALVILLFQNSLDESFEVSVIDLSSVKKHSSPSVAVAAVLFSCLGGMQLERGLYELLSRRSQYDWISAFLLGTAFLANGIFWMAMLLRRLDAKNASGQTK